MFVSSRRRTTIATSQSTWTPLFFQSCNAQYTLLVSIENYIIDDNLHLWVHNVQLLLVYEFSNEDIIIVIIVIMYDTVKSGQAYVWRYKK